WSVTLEGVVIVSLYVVIKNDQCGYRKPLSDHHVEDIVLAGERAANGTEAEHQRVAQEECDDRGDDGRERGAGEASEVRGGGSARHEGSDDQPDAEDRKSTRLNSSHVSISYAVFCLKKK